MMSTFAMNPAQNSPSSEISLSTVLWRGRPTAALEVGALTYRLAPAWKRVGGRPMTGLIDLFDDWDRSKGLLLLAAGAVSKPDLLPQGLKRLAPLRYPGKVLCAGANYHRHLAEMGVADTRKEAQRLFFFFKPARNAVVGEGETVHMPIATQAMDWEVELAIVIGKRARNVAVEDAMAHVAAYTIGIDFSARDHNRAPETFYKLDWVAGKANDTCCPLGPRLVLADAIPNPQDLRLCLQVNGTVKQDDTTADMIFSIAEQISTASKIMTLDPGDVILTGTPAGVGAPKQTFLSIGDSVQASIAGIGTLGVTIMPPR
jgi:2-keto-4-pentenoate hydratase/2-oxohepta-3-ene-1,7-dioic acid hydratase in catechol pathway